MSKARWADGLRKGSTKTKTYSTLPTRKEGRIQIIKDRVYEVSNPQSDPQMLQRVCFATVTSAAAKMYDIISISQEGESKPEYARQLFISQNVELLKRAAYSRVGLARHYRAAYAPKGNQQLIPNSYQVSKGSLTVPEYLVPKTLDGGSSFANKDWSYAIGGNSTNMGSLTMGQSYTAAQMWQLLFGLLPGDQVTVPQIWGGEIAQALYEGDNEESAVIDKTLVTHFCAPRLVLLSEMPAATLTVTAETTDEAIANFMKAGISTDASFTELVSKIFDAFETSETEDDVRYFCLSDTYDNIYFVGDGDVRAIGVILSRYDSEHQKWQYSTSNLCCVWDFLSENSGADYFGFTIDNAIATYRTGASQNENGNFLQRGGTPDIVPPSFQ